MLLTPEDSSIVQVYTVEVYIILKSSGSFAPPVCEAARAILMVR